MRPSKEATAAVGKTAQEATFWGVGKTHWETTLCTKKFNTASTGLERCLQVPTPVVQNRAKMGGLETRGNT